jgi:endonuclease III
MRSLAHAITGMELPAVEKISESQADDPFQILIATLLSARTQDATTHAASTRLFRRARTPRSMARLSVREIEKLIYPVSFYRNKAEFVKACCEQAGLALRRHRAVHDGRADVVAGRGTEDRQPRADPGVQESR